MSAPEVTELVRRFIDDRDALTDHEYELLLAAVKASPELALQLRDQLVMDDVLSQRLAIDRGDFLAQVQQRIADHLRGEDELNRQTDELRSLALSRLESAPVEPRTSWSTIFAWSVALSLLLAVGLGVWDWRQRSQNGLVATIEEVEGEVIVHHFPAKSDEHARNGLALQPGDKLSLGDNARLSLAWSDGTRVQFAGGSVAQVPAATTGKRMYLDRGELTAQIAKQPEGSPMIFSTPHADAIVRGTELCLRVQEESTRLDVTEGQVELVDNVFRDSQLIAASESATATTAGKVARDTLRFPITQRGLIYVFSGHERPTLVRSPRLRPTALVPSGDDALFDDTGALTLAGGWFEDAHFGEALAHQIHRTGELSVELVLTADAMDGNQTRHIVSLGSDQQTNWALSQSAANLQFQAADQPLHSVANVGGPGSQSHLLISITREQISAYVDGKLERTIQAKTLFESTATKLVIGSKHEANVWRGRIAGLAIYDRALRGDEIQQNFAP